MEKRIYGPDGTVARRIVAAGGPSQSTVYVDKDSRKTLVQSVMDAEPALKMAHAIRAGDLHKAMPWGRCVGTMPSIDYFRIDKEAKREARLGGGGYAEIRARKMREYWQERPRLKV